MEHLSFDEVLFTKTDAILDRRGVRGLRDQLWPLQDDAESYLQEAGVSSEGFTSYAVIQTNIDRIHEAIHEAWNVPEQEEAERAVRPLMATYIDNVRMLMKLSGVAARALYEPKHHPTTAPILALTEAREAELFSNYDNAVSLIGMGTRRAVERGLRERKKLWIDHKHEAFFRQYAQYLRDAQKLGEASTERWSPIPSGIVDGQRPFIYKRPELGATLYALHKQSLQKIDMDIGVWQPADEHDNAALHLPYDMRTTAYESLSSNVDSDLVIRNAANWYMEAYLRGDAESFPDRYNEEMHELCFESPLS